MRIADLGLQKGRYKSWHECLSQNIRKYSKYVMEIFPKDEKPDAGDAPWSDLGGLVVSIGKASGELGVID